MTVKAKTEEAKDAAWEADDMMGLLYAYLAADNRSQRQLAADSGIAMAQIHHFRNVTRSLSLRSGLKLASALGLGFAAKRSLPARAKFFYGSVREFLDHLKGSGIVPKRGKPIVVRIGQSLNAIAGVDGDEVIHEIWMDGKWKKADSLHPNGNYPFTPLSDAKVPKFEPSPKWTGCFSE